ncbi:MAG: hypothetical protein NZ108_02305, partial [Bacteroidia bacterium]|nr:hypothetical protein [Bacteroidia bacterium]
EKLSSDVKVGFRKYPIKNHTLMPDLEPRNIHSVECYKSVLGTGSPIFKLPDYDTLKSVAIALQNNPIHGQFFGEAFEQLVHSQEFQADQESLKLAFSCFISAECFFREPEAAKLSEQKLTLKEEFYSYEKLIEKLKTEMQKKILFALGDCKNNVFEATLQ